MTGLLTAWDTEASAAGKPDIPMACRYVRFRPKAEMAATKPSNSDEAALATLGFRHHVEGLISYANYIEPQFGKMCLTKSAGFEWPV